MHVRFLSVCFLFQIVQHLCGKEIWADGMTIEMEYIQADKPQPKWTEKKKIS